MRLYKLVATMDTQLHMNDDSMEWSSMGNNNEVVVTKVHQLI